jgi:hypothetical protein
LELKCPHCLEAFHESGDKEFIGIDEEGVGIWLKNYAPVVVDLYFGFGYLPTLTQLQAL